MSFRIVFLPEVLIDIQDAIDWYNLKQRGLGRNFYNVLIKHQAILRANPLIFNIRYDEIHCLKIGNYPFMFHYKVDLENKKIIVLALFHTSRDPKFWDFRKDY